MIDTLKKYDTLEEKASYFYKYFRSNGTSKAVFAQQLALELEEKYNNRPEKLKKVLPEYLVNAIEYVTRGDDL